MSAIFLSSIGRSQCIKDTRIRNLLPAFSKGSSSFRIKKESNLFNQRSFSSIIPNNIYEKNGVASRKDPFALCLSSQSADLSSASLSRHPFKSPRNAPSDSSSNEEYTWNQLGLIQELVDGLEKNNIVSPTPIQRMAIPNILGGGVGTAFAAATGSGKTLAYLLPIIQLLKGQEYTASQDSQSNDGSVSNRNLRVSKRPRALVLAPTRELSVQILSVLKSLSHTAKFSSGLLIGGEDYGKQRKMLESKPIDILVATPGRFVKHMEAGNVFIGSVSHVVMDEVDTMLEQGFQGDIAKIVHPMLYGKIQKGGLNELREDAPQVILTTATLTNAVKRLLGDKNVKPGKNYVTHNKQETIGKNTILLPPSIRLVEAPGLHRSVPTLQQIFVDVGQTDKLALLIDAVQSHRYRGSTKTNSIDQDDYDYLDGYSGDDDHIDENRQLTLVFCNTVSSCRAAEHALAEAGIESLSYHGELNSIARSENLAAFRDGNPSLLVCTDIAARGLDVPDVDHVVMFDFPLNPLDYLHRSGRTARGTDQVKSKGKVTALVAKRDKVLAKAIENAVIRGDPLDSLTGRKSDYAPGGKLRSSRRFSKNGSNGQKKKGNNHSRFNKNTGNRGSSRRK